MVYTCFLCKWRSDKHPQRSYHKFPTNNELKQKWLDILGKSNVSVGTRTTLCCLHFEEDCFRHGLVYGRKVLKGGSLPTLYLTKGDTKGQTINSTDGLKLTNSLMDSNLQTQQPTTDNVRMKDPAPELNIEDNQILVSTSELDIENNLSNFPLEVCLLEGSPRKSFSNPLDVHPGKAEISLLKKNITMLKCSVKRLRSSKSHLKSRLTELKKTVIKYEAENKLMHMEKDIANYNQYKMGFSQRLQLADGALPSKFDCQQDSNKRSKDITENSTKLTKRRDTKKMYEEPTCTTFKQEGEMDGGGSSIESTSITNIDTTMDSKTKISAEQTSILCDFFEANPEVIRGYKRTPECMDKVQIKWKTITPHLNAVGPPRDPRSWAKYLCDMKAKLKRKSIKWRLSCDGKDPVMCNTDDFNEIRLRMLQVLRKDVADTHESQDSLTSDFELEDDNNYYHDDLNEGENLKMNTLPEEIADVKPKLERLDQNELVISYDPPPDSQPRQLVFEDEFDHFGKNVAEQLRTLPLLVALETQEMLLSVLKKQRLKVLSSLDPLTNGF